MTPHVTEPNLPTPFGVLADGTPVHLVELSHPSGFSVTLSTLGATITQLLVPLGGRAERRDVVLGYQTFDAYQSDPYYMGCLVGRCANRIAQGRFRLGGEEYILEQNQGTNHLHGGSGGFHRRVFGIERLGRHYLRLRYRSGDLEEGYPGALELEVTYSLREPLTLRIHARATADRDTLVNLTQHAYYNLGGPVEEHLLRLACQRFTPIDEQLIPTGELRSVRSTAFDFTELTRIGDRIDQPEPQLAIAGGFDHNFVIDGLAGSFCRAATLVSPTQDLVMDLSTTLPGVQFYSGNFLPENKREGSHGRRFGYRDGLCLETQHFPDSPNQPHFPSVVFGPQRPYEAITELRFLVP